MLTFSEFKAFYKDKGRCPNDTFRRKNPLNEKQLNRRFEAYRRAENKRLDRETRQRAKNRELRTSSSATDRQSDPWEETKRIVHQRDDESCRLYAILTERERKIADEVLRENYHFTSLVCAHVIGRGEAPHMKHDADNVVLMYQIFHDRIDRYQNPLNGDAISSTQRNLWWMRIVGRYEFANLLERKAHG